MFRRNNSITEYWKTQILVHFLSQKTSSNLNKYFIISIIILLKYKLVTKYQLGCNSTYAIIHCQHKFNIIDLCKVTLLSKPYSSLRKENKNLKLFKKYHTMLQPQTPSRSVRLVA